MTDIQFSPKQKEALSLLNNDGLHRINILEGSVRSGKTWISTVMWGIWVMKSPKSSAYLMAGKTLFTLKRNVLDLMQQIFGDSFSFNMNKKEAELCGRRIYLEGCCNSQAESKIRGMTLMGAYCDELTLFPKEFFAMLLSRLSERGAKLFATTNPDSPSHWVKRDYLDNKRLDLLSVKFSIDDNIFLSEDYVRSLKTEYSGVLYDRYILGNWVAAEGRIYENFGSENIISPDILEEKLSENRLIMSVIGVDYGGSGSASAFLHVGFDAGFRNVYVLGEYYDKTNRSAENIINAFSEFVRAEKSRFPTLSAAYCDSAEQLLIKSFRQSVRMEVKNALKKPVNTRINMLNRLISAKRFFICEDCIHIIDAIQTALWDDKVIGKDVRLDNGTTNIDSLDALEYAIERYEKHLFRF